MSGPGEAAGGLRLRIGRATIDASAHAAVMTAITEANARARVAGLPDELTPAVIDVAKAEALLAGLGAASALGGRALILDAVSLGISAASPTSADSYRAPVRLAVTSEHFALSAFTLTKPTCILAKVFWLFILTASDITRLRSVR